MRKEWTPAEVSTSFCWDTLTGVPHRHQGRHFMAHPYSLLRAADRSPGYQMIKTVLYSKA